jgi:thiosulfate reductase cytochrome b subunit
MEMATTTDAEQSEEAVLVHRRGNRWMHWINFPLLSIMIYTGLRIYWANDVYRIGPIRFFPDRFNEVLDLNRHLARGMAFHFSFAWLFVINGALYVIYLTVTRGWSQILPDRVALREAWHVLAYDLRIRREAPPQGIYNAAQKLTYTGVIGLGGLAVVSGFAIYKPIQLSWLTGMFGGYEGARLVHFGVTMLFVAFFVVHILQVARAGWSNFVSMVTGYRVQRVEVAPVREEDASDA